MNRLHRLHSIAAARWRSFRDLRESADVASALASSRAAHLMGFNGNVLRARIVLGLAESLGATCLVETGTYHGATALAARRLLGVPVESCELSVRNYLISRVLALGTLGIQLHRGNSPDFLASVCRRFRTLGTPARPLFYLDAHEGEDPASLPLREELGEITAVEEFAALIDDFVVPGESAFRSGTYGGVPVDLPLIAPVLRGAGIGACYFPAYAPEIDTGYPSGYAVIWRSSAVDQAWTRGGFPFNLLTRQPVAEAVRQPHWQDCAAAAVEPC